MASSERGHAVAVVIAHSRIAAPPSSTTGPIQLAWVRLGKARLLFVEAADIGQDRVDLAFGESLAESGHGARFALLDAVDQIFVATLAAGELRRLAGLAAAALVTEATQGRKHLLAVDIVGRGLRLRRCCMAGCARSRRLGLLRWRSGWQHRERNA